jgi:hypothetical protein
VPGQLLAAAAKAKPPMYYLGDTYRGLKIGDVLRSTVMYGTTCKITVGEEGGCAPPYQLATEAFTKESWAIAMQCSRLPDIRGVPAVSFGGGVQQIFATTVVKVPGATGNEDPVDATAQSGPSQGPTSRRHEVSSSALRHSRCRDGQNRQGQAPWMSARLS